MDHTNNTSVLKNDLLGCLFCFMAYQQLSGYLSPS